METWRDLRRLVERCRRVACADLFLLSPPKCGRTWLRVMLTHHWHQRWGIPASEVVGFDNLHRLQPRIPRLFHTHLLNEPAPLRQLFGPAVTRGRPVVLLVRDPRDALVSLHTHFRFRSSPREWRRFGLRDDPRAMSLAAFLRHSRIGLPAFVDLYARLAEWLDRHPRCLLLRFEDLRSDPAGTLRRLLAFLDEPVEADAIARTVAFASIDSLRALEASGFFRAEILRPGNPDDPRSFKTRRGASGGWREEVPAGLQAALEEAIAGRLDPRFGYGRASAPAVARARSNAPGRAGSARSS